MMLKLFIKKSLFLILIQVFIISCASTNELPVLQDYGTRDDYPHLIEKNYDGDGVFMQMEFNRKSFEKMHRKFEEYANRLNCTAKGKINFSIVVTKNRMIDAPVFIKSLSKNCDEAALRALRYLKFDKPARVNGKPVNAVIAIPFRL